MSYTIYYNFGGNTANSFIIQDGTVDGPELNGNTFIVDQGSTSVRLPGRNYAGYGGPVDQSLVDLTQNFARFTGALGGPVQPIPGQLWYDYANTDLKLNTSTSNVASWDVIPLVGSNVSFNSVTTSNITTGNNTTAGTITGNWTLTGGSRLNATYADLAERFEADCVYEYGTVLELGGDKEVTLATDELSENIFGVVSDTAGYLMNSAAGSDETHPPIAMTGRVQVKVIGKVKKGERLVSAGNGFARAAKQGEATSFNTVGRALEHKTSDGQGKVLAAVSAKL